MFKERRLPSRRGQPDGWEAVTPWVLLDDDVATVTVGAYAVRV